MTTISAYLRGGPFASMILRVPPETDIIIRVEKSVTGGGRHLVKQYRYNRCEMLEGDLDEFQYIGHCNVEECNDYAEWSAVGTGWLAASYV